jgi:hypothetical protein
MKLSLLLERLQNRVGVTLQAETTDHIRKERTFHLTGTLTVFPHGARPTWYPLIIPDGEDNVDEREIRAILRHFWQLQKEDDFFKD